jgi:hypothetical protein
MDDGDLRADARFYSVSYILASIFDEKELKDLPPCAGTAS